MHELDCAVQTYDILFWCSKPLYTQLVRKQKTEEKVFLVSVFLIYLLLFFFCSDLQTRIVRLRSTSRRSCV